MNNCQTELCNTTFRVGGKLQVQSSSGGGNLSFPLPLSATVIEVNGRAP
jgi:hypothetical protein